MNEAHHIYVYNFVTRELEWEKDMIFKMSSIRMSQNSRDLLVNLVNGQALMINLDTQLTIHTFKSEAKGGQFMIRAVYGGANENFVIFGSEGIYIHPFCARY